MTTSGDTNHPTDPLEESEGGRELGRQLEELEERRHFPTGEDLKAASDEFAPVEPGPLRSEPEDEHLVSVLTNAIGFEVFHADGRPRVIDGENVKIETSDVETSRARSAAVRTLRELRGLGLLDGSGRPSLFSEDGWEQTKTLRAWLAGGTVEGPELLEELNFWRTYLGGDVELDLGHAENVTGIADW